MTILSTSAFYERSTLNMNTLRKQAESLQAQIASGQRLSRSSDDPVAAARLRELARADTISAASLSNANRANADLTLANSAVAEIANNLARAQELATQAANGTLNDAQRQIIGEQLANIKANLIALANSRDSAGHALFGGEAAGNAYSTDGSGNAVYIGTSSSNELPLGDGQSVVRGVTGPEVFNFTHNGTSTDLFAVIGTLAAALSSGTGDPTAAANEALGAMNAGLEKITTTQTVLGARMNWVDLNIERYQRQGEMRADEQSVIGSTDVSSAITQLQQMMTVLEASQASFVKLANLSLFNLIQ
ncbi:flagellar biosynthesis protein FlgL [Tsuneonella sp. CC-YZS046]|uniref:flagellin N-terminal helical domain-containing protein n=1 Tax=Tsuneonella sp. CC-YZS046 TaxID=3042152 RepID=UPI002D769ECC|nr:flagellar biosynthesis protein FlgL [Tsuneonella sp. CC-YZS046]WRO66800.1 flagellar biosynthesis protein FlgL [Tsuneonella sp. CC-YZS046]